MKNAQQSVKNTAKNALLLGLIASLLVLCAINWLVGMNVREMPADNPLRQAYAYLFGGARGYELRSSGVAAAEPAQLALTVEGRLCMVQYSLADMDAGIEAVRAVWAQVLRSTTLVDASEEELIASLSTGDCALLRYHGEIPLSLIAGWMGGTWQEETAVHTLVYAAHEEKLFVRTGDGSLYAAAARVDREVWEAAQQAFRGMPCRFSGEAYAVLPETLLPDTETLSLPILTSQAPALLDPQSGSGLETLLEAFSYTPYTRFYDEQGGDVRVFVEDESTLRIGRDGLVQYAAADESGTVRAYGDGEADGAAALDAQADCARQILDAALRAADSDTHASLYAVQRQEGQTTLVFLQMYGGIPILSDTDFATFTFREGVLVSAQVRLNCFRAEQTRRQVLPARQAAAAATDARGLMVAYTEMDGHYQPERFYI